MTEHTAEFLKLVDVLYQDHPAGGPLHVELDDWNLDGEFSLKPGSMVGNYDDGEANLACLTYVVQRICDLANQMTPDQRMAALAMREEWIPMPEATPHG